jgi:3-isopropylmalate/(R)-2-methylmalate dehydratase large subunit
MNLAKTIYEKIWDDHLVKEKADGISMLYVDRHYLYEVSSPAAFEGLRLAGRTIRRPSATIATMDHNIPTTERSFGVREPASRRQVEALRQNCREFGLLLFDLDHQDNGIMHAVFPELGYTLPGSVIACGDSHTPTHGALGALAYGIGTSEDEHVFATRTLLKRKSKTLLVKVAGTPSPSATAKDIALFVLRSISPGEAAGHVVELTGPAVDKLSVEGRMTLCNMSVELGCDSVLIAPDAKTLEYLYGRRHAPTGKAWEVAACHWLQLRSDVNACYDKVIELNVEGVKQQVTWGTSPSQSVAIDDAIPSPWEIPAREAAAAKRALQYMGLKAGSPVAGLPIDFVFIGSCTNGRIEDLRAAAEILAGKKVASGVAGMVVPATMEVKREAERDGLDRIFTTAGLQWHHPGCSMCLGMNEDILESGKYCASTSNRNFENRQGRGARTFLVSPQVAAASAIVGRLAAP